MTTQYLVAFNGNQFCAAIPYDPCDPPVATMIRWVSEGDSVRVMSREEKQALTRSTQKNTEAATKMVNELFEVGSDCRGSVHRIEFKILIQKNEYSEDLSVPTSKSEVTGGGMTKRVMIRWLADQIAKHTNGGV